MFDCCFEPDPEPEPAPGKDVSPYWILLACVAAACLWIAAVPAFVVRLYMGS